MSATADDPLEYLLSVVGAVPWDETGFQTIRATADILTRAGLLPPYLCDVVDRELVPPMGSIIGLEPSALGEGDAN